MKLTAKQQRFIEEYLVRRNGTQAAIKAGYSKKTAFVIATENLKKPYIAQAIKEKMDELSRKTDITAQRVLNRIAEISFKFEAQDRDALRGCELLAKHLGLFVEKKPDDVPLKDRAELIKKQAQENVEKLKNRED